MAAFTALALAGLALGAYGQVKAGQQQKVAGEAGAAASESQAQLAEYNAGISDLQAQDAVERGAQEENRYRTQIRAAIGSQRSGQAANNVDVGFGSSVDVQADAAFLGELDALTIRTNAAREAWGYKVQATDFRNRAKVARQTGVFQEAAGRASATAGYLNAATTLAGGGASLLKDRYGFTKAAA